MLLKIRFKVWIWAQSGIWYIQDALSWTLSTLLGFRSAGLGQISLSLKDAKALGYTVESPEARAAVLHKEMEKVLYGDSDEIKED